MVAHIQRVDAELSLEKSKKVQSNGPNIDNERMVFLARQICTHVGTMVENNLKKLEDINSSISKASSAASSVNTSANSTPNVTAPNTPTKPPLPAYFSPIKSSISSSHLFSSSESILYEEIMNNSNKIKSILSNSSESLVHGISSSSPSSLSPPFSSSPKSRIHPQNVKSDEKSEISEKLE